MSPTYAGYAGMEPEFTLASGRVISAGELIAEHALPLYHQAFPGLDESQVPAAWNAASDVERKGYCIQAFDALDQAAQQAAAVDDQRSLLATVAPRAELVLGDGLMDVVLQELRALTKPWQTLTEDQQETILERATQRVREVARLTVRELAARGTHHIVATLEQITIKKGAKAVLAIPAHLIDENLTESVQQQVILVLAGELKAADEIKQPQADLQQPGLPLGDSGVVHSDPED